MCAHATAAPSRAPECCVPAMGVEQRYHARHARLKLLILSLSFADDEYMSERNIEPLRGLYADAPRDMRRVTPSEIGATAIGHFGFFRNRFEDTLWQRAGDWLDRQAGPEH